MAGGRVRPILIPSEERVPKGAYRELISAAHELYRNAGCPSTRRISSAVAKMDSLQDVISHTAVADILNGKRFPAWPKMEALTVALLVFARAEVTKNDIARIREFWLAVRYDGVAGAPPIEFAGTTTSQTFAEESTPTTIGDLFKVLEDFDSRVRSTARSDHDPSELQVKQVVGSRDGESKFDDLHMRFVSQNSPGPGMFEVNFLPGMLEIAINKQHPMGESILRALEHGDDYSSSVIKHLLASWARMEDEIPGVKARSRVANIRNDWGRYGRDVSAPNTDSD